MKLPICLFREQRADSNIEDKSFNRYFLNKTNYGPPVVCEDISYCSGKHVFNDVKLHKVVHDISLVITSRADIHWSDILRRLPVVGNRRSKLPKSLQFAIYAKNNIPVSIWIMVSAVF